MSDPSPYSAADPAAAAITATERSEPSSLKTGIRQAGPIAIAGMVANGSNVIMTVAIAHLLTARAYGSLIQLVGLFLMLTIPGSALQVAVVRKVTAWNVAGQHHLTAAWATRARRTGAIALGAWILVALAVRAPLADLLVLSSPKGVTEVLIAGGAWAILAVERGLIQSRQAYSTLAISLCVEAAARTVLTVGLVAAGLGVEGAALALVGAMGAALIHARTASCPVAHATDCSVVRDRGRRLFADLATAVAALGMLAALQNLDVLVVGHQDPSVVGAYGPISVSSKAVVFAALVLSGYLLPETVRRHQQGGDALRQLATALGLVFIPVVILGGIALFWAAPLLRVAFGPDKTGAAPALATMAVAMGCLAASVLFTHYLLGLGRRRVVAVLAVAVVALVIAVAAAHGRPIATARTELIVQGALAVVLGVLVLLAGPRHTPATSEEAAAAR